MRGFVRFQIVAVVIVAIPTVIILLFTSIVSIVFPRRFLVVYVRVVDRGIELVQLKDILLIDFARIGVAVVAVFLLEHFRIFFIFFGRFVVV